MQSLYILNLQIGVIFGILYAFNNKIQYYLNIGNNYCFDIYDALCIQ